MSSTTLRATYKLSITYILIFSAVFIGAASSTPTPFNFGEWVHGELYPTQGYNPDAELHCYSLPYGAYGILSHILTYYTLLCVAYGKKPLLPWKEESKPSWNVLLVVFSTLGTVVSTGFTISACRNRWQFVLLGIWKLMLSVCSNVAVLTQAVAIYTTKSPKKKSEDYICMGAYLLGSLIGLVGLLSIVSEEIASNKNVLRLTLVFGIVVAVLVVGLLILRCCWSGLRYHGFECGCIFILLIAFYADWSLAAVTGNWSGQPSEDIAIVYWAYFAAKRLLMLIW